MPAEVRASNEVLGVDGTVLDDGAQSGVMRARVRVRAGGNAGPAHLHLHQEERFIVHEGTLRVRRGRESIRIGPGDELAVPPGTSHTFEAETEALFETEFRPALRVAEFFQKLFDLPLSKRGSPRLRDAAQLMREYPDEFFYVAAIPVGLQRALGRVVSALARG
jgi:mannose-6-phosphate isomerase-like protein (cupin superfamily)